MTQEESPKGVPTVQFRTKDLNQAAFMWCQQGAKLLRIDGVASKKHGGRGQSLHFVFELPMDERDLSALIIRYANRETRVEPQEFVSRQDNLRDLLHGSLRRTPKETKEDGRQGRSDGNSTEG